MGDSHKENFIWKDGNCQLCRTGQFTVEEREQHEAESEHKRKLTLYNFMTKDLQFVRPNPNALSILFDRYVRAQAPVVGLNYLLELIFPWSTSPYWLCGLCYDVGHGLDSADLHLYSSCHRRNFIAEVYPERYEEMLAKQCEYVSTKHSNVEHETALEILKEKKGIGPPPEVFNVILYEKRVALEKLHLQDEELKLEFLAEEVTDNHQIFNCQVCGENIMSYTDEEQHQKVWSAHCATSKHQKCQMIQASLNESNISKRYGYPDGFIAHEKLVWALEEEVFYGPSCGIEFLINFGDEYFCKLCNCLVLREESTNHFSCESHIVNYL
uniref:Uncharacterized protein n=1 Tax=Acrobeloides nanus TaxID=290746 RepID=A0A914EDR9_9BILA